MNKDEFIKSIQRGGIGSWYMDIVSVPVFESILSETEDVLAQFLTLEKVVEKDEQSYVQETYVLSTHKLYRIVIKKDIVDIEAIPVNDLRGIKFENAIQKDFGTYDAVPKELRINLKCELNGVSEMVLRSEQDSKKSLSEKARLLTEFASAVSSILK